MTEVQLSMIFDSWNESGPELRSRAVEDRHLIYEGGGVILDLVLKTAHNGTNFHIGGQVLPESTELSRVSDVEVSLKNGHYEANTHTNALGEFAFGAVPKNGGMSLLIKLDTRRFVVQGLSHKEPRMWRVVEAGDRSH